MTVIKPSVFKQEECFEFVNNIKVLQPLYIRNISDRKAFTKKIEAFKREHSGKYPKNDFQILTQVKEHRNKKALIKQL